ncbi:hypothetical protein [Xanthomonas perforans]|uniref:hypothetical protein n=1 Tax=Xanthomonas perforans TaxID=442694 RepID=UPI000F8CC1E9|nr:hypothetical protein [Xanthomonas perforans]MDC9651475.1 hypothetical protein [Xanthomonas perforans]MDC9658324.1 hypothetical protein [Xanthomonas perforans]MDC9679107.1 hypothetical protein [Xanthomonas perforans]MDC9680024.1 hypothetical protein [Xanthomonas perforans]MDC9684239.1 hypothetical protein [Xanthomonas perforans]
MNEHSGNSGQWQAEQRAHVEELTELRRLVPSVNQRAALDAAIAALAARQPVGEPVAFVPVHPSIGPLWGDTYPAGSSGDGRPARYERRPLYTAPPAQADRMAIKMLVAAGFVSEEKANESLRIAHGFGGDLGQPAPVAVPVGLQDIIGSMLNYAGVADTCEVTQGHAPVAIRNWAEMLQQLAWPAAVPVDGEGWSGWATQYPGKMPVLRGAREIAELNYHPEEGQRLLFLTSATHPQPAANSDKGMADEYQDWIDFYHRGDGDYGDFLRRVVLPRYTSEQPTAAKDGDA